MRESQRKYIVNLAITAAALLLSSTVLPAYAQSKQVLGLIETVRLEPEGVLVNAKLDTGASTTSLDARGIRIVKRDGKRWVQFEYHDGAGHVIRFERSLARFSNVRSAPGVTERRPVVMLEICMGGARKEVEVNLVDRDKLDFQMLIGRNFLIGARIIVDSALKLTSPPACDRGGA